MTRITRILLVDVLLLALILCVAASAEHLPFTTYTAVHGLNATDINAVVEDRQGFLWIGTDNGLWRFDGWTFRSFGREQGLTRRNITSLALAGDGTLWVGAGDGAFHFSMAGGGAFVEVPIEGNLRFKPCPLTAELVSCEAQAKAWAYDRCSRT